MGSEFLFMDDNARPHCANIVDECLQSEDITRMDWPAYTPDLNPIDQVWDMLGRRIAARQPPSTCLPELWRALLDEWCNIPQDQNDNLILSIPTLFSNKNILKLYQPFFKQNIIQDDNARQHRARLVENMLEAETIQRMEWPACSPDLNPIEHVWDMVRRRIAARPRPPATVRDLEIALLEDWNSVSQSLIDNLIASMANRCAVVLAVRRDHTPY
ncbi:DDE_3 domain-containing protein [Trichonephila clavipes]|nr:DDE_3 domain-containing protein [Trichonephila clavipes]